MDWKPRSFYEVFRSGGFRRFPVIPVRLEPCDLPQCLFAHSAVDAFDGLMDGLEAAKLLRSIHGVPDLTAPAAVKSHVIHYVSTLAGDGGSALATTQMPVLHVTCGWRDAANEALLRRTVCNAFTKEDFHLIGDAEDHQHTDELRIKAIMSGCSGQDRKSTRLNSSHGY